MNHTTPGFAVAMTLLLLPPLLLAAEPAADPAVADPGGYAAQAAAIVAQLPSVTNVTERVRLQLRLGDVASAMLQDKPRALAAWRAVAEEETAHPYYRALAMDKIAHTLLYREPLPNHLMASFPERQAMPEEQTDPEKLEEAVGWWRRAAALDLKAWVRLESLVGIARAYESCGKPAEGLAVLEREALALPDLTERQAAVVKSIMAQLETTTIP